MSLTTNYSGGIKIPTFNQNFNGIKNPLSITTSFNSSIPSLSLFSDSIFQPTTQSNNSSLISQFDSSIQTYFRQQNGSNGSPVEGGGNGSPGEGGGSKIDDTKKEGNWFNKKLGKSEVTGGQAIGIAADIGQNLLSTIAGPKMGFNGPNAGLQQGLDSAYDTASNAMMKVNPMVGGIMKAAGLTGNIINSVGGGTDGMTKVDAVLNSAPMTLLTLGLNGFLGKKTESITKDSEAFDQVGSSYSGTGSLVDDALTKANKKYGLLSGGARDEANALIRDAKLQQSTMANIADFARDSFAIQTSMTNINNTSRANRLMGGYNQGAMRIGRQGLKIKKIISAYNMLQKKNKLKDSIDYQAIQQELNQYNNLQFQEVEKNIIQETPSLFDFKFKSGSIIYETNPSYIENFKFQEGGSLSKKPRTLEELIKYAKQQNPRFVQRMSEHVKSIDLGNGLRGTHRLSWGTTDNPNEAIVYPKIFENENGELIYDPKRAIDNAKKGDMLIMTPEEAEIFTKGYKQGQPDFFQQFQKGGKFNVIPEGALHARKHNMDIEGITNKGIPVVSQGDGGELQQQAEIEREEIIFRLEVTKKLEELQEKYYSDNYTKKEKDDLAIEAGKLLVKEMLYNTKDNTNNLI